jgi:restriction system protein
MIWKIFARQPTGMEGSEEYAAECYTSGVIAVGWNDVGDLNKFASREKLKAACVKFWSDESNRSIGQTAGVLWNFRSSVMEGDMVICPDRESGRFYIGRILSKKAFYDCSPLGGKCRFAHRRKVSWERILQSDEIRGRFGGCQTVSAVNSDTDH